MRAPCSQDRKLFSPYLPAHHHCFHVVDPLLELSYALPEIAPFTVEVCDPFVGAIPQELHLGSDAEYVFFHSAERVAEGCPEFSERHFTS